MYTLNNECENILGASYIVLHSEAQTLVSRNKRKNTFLTEGGLSASG